MSEPFRPTMTDSRYPYTHACDYIRSFGPVGEGGVVLSRADASRIKSAIANAIGMDDREMACKLADAELSRQEDPEFLMEQTNRFLVARGLMPVCYPPNTSSANHV